MTMQNKLAVEGFRWRDVFGKHCMNELLGLCISEGKFTTSGEISPDSAYKRMLCGC
jgi:hypothetical protein